MEISNDFFELMAGELGYKSRGNVKFFLHTLLGDVDFNNKRVLDIGGGGGILTFYASINGASEAICLEPESDGSHFGMSRQFYKIKDTLGVNNVIFQPFTFQEFKCEDDYFDIILLYNSVNHLDEECCSNLKTNQAARDSYLEIFKKLEKICSKGALIILCDCSNKNFFATLGLKNPLDPNITYSLHQAPEVWSNLLLKAGFVNPQVSWSSYNSLRKVGKLLFGNKLMSFFLSSHFRLRMTK